jgi:hypothetical protein
MLVNLAEKAGVSGISILGNLGAGPQGEAIVVKKFLHAQDVSTD